MQLTVMPHHDACCIIILLYHTSSLYLYYSYCDKENKLIWFRCQSIWCDIVYLAGVAWCCLGEEEEAGGSSRRMVPATAWLCSRMRTRCSSEPISRVLTFWYALNWLRRSSSSPDSCRRSLATLVMSWNALCCASFNLRKHAGSLDECRND